MKQNLTTGKQEHREGKTVTPTGKLGELIKTSTESVLYLKEKQGIMN